MLHVVLQVRRRLTDALSLCFYWTVAKRNVFALQSHHAVADALTGRIKFLAVDLSLGAVAMGWLQQHTTTVYRT
jgi:hypothetical protein